VHVSSADWKEQVIGLIYGCPNTQSIALSYSKDQE